MYVHSGYDGPVWLKLCLSISGLSTRMSRAYPLSRRVPICLTKAARVTSITTVAD